MKDWVDILSTQGYLGAGARRQEAIHAAEVGFDLDTVEEAWVLDEVGFTVTWFFAKDGEALVRELAGRCEEGFIDVILESEVKKDRYADPKIEAVISRALLDAAAMIMESAAK
jgi:hypothetical protein